MLTLRRHILCAAVLQWSASSASAQVFLPKGHNATGACARSDAAPSEDVLFPYLRFDRINGMAKGAVTAIAQDGAGFLWFGTEEGLSRYDGYEFENYVVGKNPENTLSDFTVNALAASKEDLWVGTEKGLDRLNLTTNKFTHLKANPQNANTIGDDSITSLDLGHSGLLWIGTHDAGVDSLNPATGEIKHYRNNPNRSDSLSDDEVSVVLEGKDGNVWIGTRAQGLNLLDPRSGKVTRFPHDPDQAATISDEGVTAIHQDSAGTVWVGTLNGLNRFDPGTKSFKRYLHGIDCQNWIMTIVDGVDGGLWLGVKDIGVFRFDRGTGAIEKYTHDGGDSTSISHPTTRVAFSDRGGVLWFGFHAGGLAKLYLLRREFAYYRTKSPVLSFLEEGNQVWLGGRGAGLRLLTLKTGAVKRYLDDQLSDTWTTKIVAGENGSIWLATQDHGLMHFTPRTGELETYDSQSEVGSDTIFSMLRDQEIMWIGTYGAGMSKLDLKTKTLIPFKSDPTNPQTLSSDFITTIYQDRSRPDVLWVGTTAGLNELDKRTGKFVRYVHDPAKGSSLSQDHVTDIHEDHAGRLWITTWGGGLDRMDRKTGAFTAYHTAEGLASEVLYGILEDKSGVLWITTDDGLTRYDPDKNTTVTFRSGDGLQSDEFGQGAFYQGSGGRFYMGGPGGFNTFVPEQLKLDTYVPPLVLTKYELLGESQPIPEKLSLSYKDRWFSVSFSALAYASPMHNRYRYRLAGFDDWKESDRRFVNYSSLPSGDYTLEIVGSNAHGFWNTEGVRLPIHVRPPPWRTWWAYVGYCLVLVMIVALFLRRQRSQLAALKRTHRLSELEREMVLTSAVQEGFFPVQPSVRDGVLRLEGFYRSATECSGDWWWYEPRGDSYFIVVGDVTGHGAGSAMVTAAAAACFRSLGRRVDDEERLREMNEEVLRVSRGQYHMTLTALNLNLATGDFKIWSAGGLPVFSLAPNERNKVLMCPGMPLGSPDCEIGMLEGRLVPGERMLIMTDGIPEVAMGNTQFLGPRGVSNFYMQTRDQELKTALQQLIKKVEGVQLGAQDDDWTAVMLEWAGPERELDHLGTATAAVG